MFDESKTNFVCVADSLGVRYPEIYHALMQGCRENRIDFFPIHNCKNIWVRDWMPLQAPDLGLVKFYYGYGNDNPQFKNLRVSREHWRRFGGARVRESRIRLDGGNCQRHGRRAIVTDIILKHNLNRLLIVEQLERLLGCDVTIVPAEPDDDIGHTDGICHFAPSGKLLVGDYRMIGTRKYDRYFSKLEKSLKNFEIELVPHGGSAAPLLSERKFRKLFPNADTFNPGFGYYINLLWVKSVVFYPIFGRELSGMDEGMRLVLTRNFPGCRLIPINCRQLSMEGGLVNCVTMNYCML